MDWRVVLFDTTLDEREVEAVSQVLASGWLSMGAITKAFEQEFAQALGTSEAVAVSSGTAALHIACLALGLAPGDEVILPSMSFVAAAATIAMTGARPIFAEIKSDNDLTLDPQDVARRITTHTKAIVVMHYGGYPADMDALLALAQQHGLLIIEDAAHAPLVHTKNGMLGTVGDVGCFSFFATKNMTTAEGGMIVARDPALLSQARGLRSHCMTTSSWDKHKGRASAYDVNGLGFNYRLTDVGSALGRVQLSKIPTDREQRLQRTQTYHLLLNDLPQIKRPFANRTGDSAYHLFPIILPPEVDRSDFQASLKAQGIASSVHYPPTHLFSYYCEQYGYDTGSLPVTEDVAAREVTLPLHGCLTEEQVHMVVDAIHQALDH